MIQPKYLVLVALSFAVIGFGGSYAIAQATDKPSAQASAYSGPISVDLINDKASPDSLAVRVGQIIQFNTKDGQTHDISFGEGDGDGHAHEHTSSYSSGDFGSGQAWKIHFNKAGTYTLHDHLHPNINVVVVAYNPDK
jgi:plastocyanin